MQIQPVILSGGSGTRLWPLSREQHPKQLLPLAGELSLLQETACRLDGFAGEVAAAPLVVCNEEYRFITAEQLRAAGRPAKALVLEPAGRNTAPALARTTSHSDCKVSMDGTPCQRAPTVQRALTQYTACGSPCQKLRDGFSSKRCAGSARCGSRRPSKRSRAFRLQPPFRRPRPPRVRDR